MARGPIKPKPNIVVSSPAETGLTYNMLKMFKDDNEAQRGKVKKMEAEIQAYRETLKEVATFYSTEHPVRLLIEKTLNQFKEK